MTNALKFAAKLLVAALLIGWLVRGGAIDFGRLALFFERPTLLALNLGVFVAGVVLNGAKWRLLLSALGVHVSFPRTVQLQMTALFFNTVIPGNVGGDVLKAVYVARDARPEQRTGILLVAFVDRLVGLAGLVSMATLITAVRGPALWSDRLLRPMATAVLLLGVGVVVGPAVFLLFMRHAGARLEAWTSGSSKLARLLGQLVLTARLFSGAPKALFVALLTSMCFHATGMFFFTELTSAVTGEAAAYATIATVFPLGLLTMILPISPSGVGVGHVAFDRLFEAIGLSGGATVFNLFLIGQIAPCLLGVFPYLALRRTGALAAEASVGGPPAA